MPIRIEHDNAGQHRSTFSSHEDVAALARNVIRDAEQGQIVRLVVIHEGKERRFVLEQTVKGD